MYAVTGAAGFIGSHVVDRLLAAGARVVAVDKLDYCSSLRNVHPGAEFVAADVTDGHSLAKLFENRPIRAVVHCAANSHVDRSFLAPAEFFRNNALGTQTLLDACLRAGVDQFLQFSTDEVYGSTTGTACESTRLGPTNPYAASKAAAEMVVETYHKCYGLPTVTVRSNNVYGPRQYPEKLIPKFTLRLRDDRPCYLHGSGLHQRTFVYASDVADAVALLLDAGKPGHVYNVGTYDQHTNIEVARMLAAKLHKPLSLIQHTQDRLYNDERYEMDFSKIESLGWAPKVSFEDGIDKTISWYLREPFRWAPFTV